MFVKLQTEQGLKYIIKQLFKGSKIRKKVKLVGKGDFRGVASGKDT